MLRLVPVLPRSVGFGPVAPPQRRLRHGTVHCQRAPVDTMRLLVGHQACCPHALEHAGPHPLLKAIMYGAAGAQGAGQRLPLTARAQDVEDRLRCRAVGHPRAPASRFRAFGGQERLNLHPQRLRDRPRALGHTLHRGTPPSGALLRRNLGCASSEGPLIQPVQDRSRKSRTRVAALPAKVGDDPVGAEGRCNDERHGEHGGELTQRNCRERQQRTGDGDPLGGSHTKLGAEHRGNQPGRNESEVYRVVI